MLLDLRHVNVADGDDGQVGRAVVGGVEGLQFGDGGLLDGGDILRGGGLAVGVPDGVGGAAELVVGAGAGVLERALDVADSLLLQLGALLGGEGRVPQLLGEEGDDEGHVLGEAAGVELEHAGVDGEADGGADGVELRGDPGLVVQGGAAVEHVADERGQVGVVGRCLVVAGGQGAAEVDDVLHAGLVGDEVKAGDLGADGRAGDVGRRGNRRGQDESEGEEGETGKEFHGREGWIVLVGLLVLSVGLRQRKRTIKRKRMRGRVYLAAAGFGAPGGRGTNQPVVLWFSLKYFAAMLCTMAGVMVL